MSKTRANRRKTVRARKAARQRAFREREYPIVGIVWECSDPACLEGIHQVHPSDGGNSRHDEERPSPASKGRSAIRPKVEFGGATGANGTQP
jgi:hypothetical protein